MFDLPHCLGHRRQRYQLSDSLITIHDGELKVTFLVNQVREVVQIDPESITRKFIYQPQEGGSPSPDVAWGDSPSLPLRQRQRFLKGVVQIQTHLVSLLDEEAILQALRQQVPEDDEFIEESEERSQQQEPERDRVEFCPDASLEEQDVFRQRANRLRTPTETPDLNQIISLAVVALQGEYFGIDLQVVREFTDVRYITPIPCCPPHVVGNMNLRGEILTLIRINQCLNLEPTLSEGDRHPEQRRRAVVVQVDKMVVGILVDEVFDVTPINPRNISPMPTAIRATSDEYLQGTVLYEATALTILDIRKLLTQGELVVDEEP